MRKSFIRSVMTTKMPGMINVINFELHYYDNVVYWSVLQLMMQQHHTDLEKSLGVQYPKPAL